MRLRPLILAALAGCGGSAPASRDASVDGAIVGDAALDGAGAWDGAVVDATAIDSSPVDATPADADPCTACIASSECMEAYCDGTCAERPVTDGLVCGGSDATICVEGACVVRECGDGYREPGPTPAREACDDGNADSGDACSDTCGPTMLVIAARPGASDYPPGGPLRAIGVDGAGNVLAVWKAINGGPYDVNARRFTAAGVPLDAAPIVIAVGFDSAWEAEPVVAGLTEGWVVSWTSPSIDGDSAGVAYVVVDPDGTLGPTLQANQEDFVNQNNPAATGLGAGFAIAWTDTSPLAVGDGARIMTRVFLASGTPAGDEVRAFTSTENQGKPTIAGNGDRFLIAWASAPLVAGAVPDVLARRFWDDASPVDSMPVLVSDVDATGAPAWSSGASAVSLGADGWAIAWTSRGDDAYGDVRTTTLPRTGAAVPAPSIAVAADPGVRERAASLAPLGAGTYVVLWHHAGGADVVDDIHLTPIGATLVPEAAEVELLLAGIGYQQNGNITAAPGRMWITWSDDGAVAGVNRAFVGEIIPVE